MKLISFAVPCYNSSAYMEKCIKSLLKAGDDVEIIIVDDGSTKDNTFEIAQKYEKEFPTIIKAVHQENGGHGEAVNTGLKFSQGIYYKVVDSDDWVDESALKTLIEDIKNTTDEQLPDAYVVNYVYEHVETNSTKVVDYRKEFPTGRNFAFNETKKMSLGKFLAMHSMVYKTKLLRDCGLVLPKHTFYVDNIVVYQPLPFVKTFRYLDVDFYRYYIGRSDQSVNEQVLMGRIDQHIRVTEEILGSHNLAEIKKTDKKLYKYMLSFVSIMMTINSIYLIKIGTEESYAKKKSLWQSLKEKDAETYKKCKRAFIVGMGSSDNKFICGICKGIYVVVRKIFKFN